MDRVARRRVADAERVDGRATRAAAREAREPQVIHAADVLRSRDRLTIAPPAPGYASAPVNTRPALPFGESAADTRVNVTPSAENAAPIA